MVFQTLEGSCLAPYFPKRSLKRTRKYRRPRLGKRGPYTKYSAAVRADVGKYACQHGAARHFSRKLKKHGGGLHVDAFVPIMYTRVRVIALSE